MVPTLTWGLLRSNFSLATLLSSKMNQSESIIHLNAAYLHNSIGDILRSFDISQKLHTVGRTSLGCRAQVGGVTKHFCQRHVCVNNLAHGAFIHSMDHTAAAV